MVALTRGEQPECKSTHCVCVCVCVFWSTLHSEVQNTNFTDTVKTFLRCEAIKAGPFSNFKGPFKG